MLRQVNDLGGRLPKRGLSLEAIAARLALILLIGILLAGILLPALLSAPVFAAKPFEVRDLVKTFGGGRSLFGRQASEVHAVRGISLDLKRGETLGIVGESGSGKSVLLKHIVGLELPTSGRVSVDGRDAAAEDTREQVRMALVFQAGVQALRIIPDLTMLGATFLQLLVRDLARFPTPDPCHHWLRAQSRLRPGCPPAGAPARGAPAARAGTCASCRRGSRWRHDGEKYR